MEIGMWQSETVAWLAANLLYLATPTVFGPASQPAEDKTASLRWNPGAQKTNFIKSGIIRT